MALSAFAAAAIMAAAPACVPHVKDGHVVRATGTKSFVKAKKGGARELVVRGVEPTAVRRVIEEDTGCDIDLEEFEQRFLRAPYELHARVRRHAILVQSFTYDAAAKTLRVQGRHEREPKREQRSAPRQTLSATQLVFASTFIPFDSSF
jgi:hypothetical protein